jgi:hypothetical protein
MNCGKFINQCVKNLELFSRQKKDYLLIGLWLANLYLITRTFGDYFGTQYGTFIAALGAMGMFTKKWFYYWIKKYGALKIFSIISGLTILHAIVSVYVIKPLKANITK